MQSSLIPGLDYLTISANNPEEESGSKSVISLPIFQDNFCIPASLSNGNCRPLTDFKKEKLMRERVTECFYQCQDMIKKRPVTLLRYMKLEGVSLDEELKSLLHELEIVRSLKHFHILQYHEMISSHLTNVFLVYEPCVCFLSDLIEGEVEKLYQLSTVKTVMLQILEALNYMHEHSIMHRNIKPENIAFTDSGCLKVCTFRNARWLWDEDNSIKTDEIRYQSPELLMGTKICTTSVDIWSAACILVELLLLRPFFPINDLRHTLKEIFSIFGFPTKECWPEFFELPEFAFFFYDEQKTHSHNYLNAYFEIVECPQRQSTVDLLQSMFCLNPKNRFTASQCSSHPFFSEDPKASPWEELVLCSNIALTRQAVRKLQKEVKK